MIGTLVNAGCVIGGSLLGCLLKKGIPEEYQATIMQGLGICVAMVGAQMALRGNMLIVISSIALGGLVGEALGLDKRLNMLGDKLSRLVMGRFSGSADGLALSKGFVTATLVYCVGAMSVLGSIQDGLTGDRSTLFVKALLDGVSSVFFAASMGIGVAFSALPVLLYQGGITLLAGRLAVFLSEAVIAELSATGGVIIIGISLLVLDLCPVKVANLLPALFFAVLITSLYTNLV